jgi:hypothetical protein
MPNLLFPKKKAVSPKKGYNKILNSYLSEKNIDLEEIIFLYILSITLMMGAIRIALEKTL